MKQQTPRVRAFLEAIVALSKASGLVLGHEDWQGAFEVYNADNTDGAWHHQWLLAASDRTQEEGQP